MEAAWRMHIVERNGEDQSPEESREEARKAASARVGTPANDMVTLVYCLEKWVQMIRGFNLRGGRDEHQRQAGPTKPTPKRIGEAEIVDRFNSIFHRSTQLADPRNERGDHRCGE
jgi:hypothetical protein